jgi:hypothetical protein
MRLLYTPILLKQNGIVILSIYYIAIHSLSRDRNERGSRIFSSFSRNLNWTRSKPFYTVEIVSCWAILDVVSIA